MLCAIITKMICTDIYFILQHNVQNKYSTTRYYASVWINYYDIFDCAELSTGVRFDFPLFFSGTRMELYTASYLLIRRFFRWIFSKYPLRIPDPSYEPSPAISAFHPCKKKSRRYHSSAFGYFFFIIF